MYISIGGALYDLEKYLKHEAQDEDKNEETLEAVNNCLDLCRRLEDALETLHGISRGNVL